MVAQHLFFWNLPLQTGRTKERGFFLPFFSTRKSILLPFSLIHRISLNFADYSYRCRQVGKFWKKGIIRVLKMLSVITIKLFHTWALSFFEGHFLPRVVMRPFFPLPSLLLLTATDHTGNLNFDLTVSDRLHSVSFYPFRETSLHLRHNSPHNSRHKGKTQATFDGYNRWQEWKYCHEFVCKPLPLLIWRCEQHRVRPEGIQGLGGTH